ncbi:hypothetical protein IFM89_003465 [Coptis chinensis]|uniref:Uncharacterized protein n=1 Tax=Coptis chinensis TaxID=261450 RepID=A0A835HF59_9MAGN|nr:hypothetical protein IFM89_003465 [Coptis chinensis]
MASSSQRRMLSPSPPSCSQHRTMPQSSPSAHANGRVTGVYSAKWSSRVGYWIRAIVPISYASWDKIDGSFKDEVWLKLMEEFQLNVNPTMGARKNIEKWFAPKFRYWKYVLRGKILKNCESEQEAISSCPTGFDPIHWEAFPIHENRQEVKDMCAKNAENRSMNLIGHTCGRKSYGRILEELDESNPEKKHRRTDSWKYGHKHRDETVLERAQEYYGILEHVRLNGSANGQPSTPTTEVDSTSPRPS